MRFTLAAAKALLLGAALAFAVPVASTAAFAKDPPAEQAHGADSHADDGHGDDAHGDDAHGGGHAIEPLADDNHNGVVNFLDGEDEHFANSWGHSVALQWVWHLLNFGLMIGLLVFFGRKGIAFAVRERSLAIQKTLDDAAEVEHGARQRYQVLEQRIAGFEDEVARMRAEAENTAQVEHDKSLKRASETAARIRESATRTIRDETLRATRELRTEAVELAVKLAEETLRNEVGGADRQRLARDLLASLGSEAGGHHG